VNRSGRSIFAAPKPIDLSGATRASESRLDDIDLPGEVPGQWEVDVLVFDAESQTPMASPMPRR
jgi:hypothetical protein